MVVVTCALVGCGNANLRVESALPHAAPTPVPAAATVVFMRTGQFGPGRSINLVDARTDTVFAQLGAETWSAVQLPPGNVDWYLSLDDIGAFDSFWARFSPVDRVEGVVTANRVYYVFVAPTGDAACSGCGSFEVMRPGHPQWDARGQYLRDHTRVEVDAPSAASYSRDDLEELAEARDGARRRFAQMNPEQRSKRILVATDGLGGPADRKHETDFGPRELTDHPFYEVSPSAAMRSVQRGC
ncbi:MAG: hypothetical protein DRJ42_27775 [Deltaproteobacteria bacterium]|nr:MAG: hypothetical protein DRJ42_27775 [Deltaproteobacteria bacterium]